LYCGSLQPSSTASYVKAVRAEAAKNGRDPQSIKFFAGISPIIGRTVEEAQEKYDACRKNIDVIGKPTQGHWLPAHILIFILGGLSKFSGYTNIDMSVYPLDEEFNFTGRMSENIIQGIINNFKAGHFDNKPWPPRRVGEKMAVRTCLDYSSPLCKN
jgi:alkanesulfonate monooxygenase SsuD/methylene tetrahydromethanopterin reductase-like flavin-dependent oxidoreductase (luciferase family)